MLRSSVLLLALALPAQACPQAPTIKAEAPQLLAAVNAQRVAHNLSPLVWSENLTLASALHACDNAAKGQISHEGQDGSRPAQRALAAGYSYRMVAENLGLGFQSARQAVEMWMTSPPHRANILAPQAQEAGFGMALTPNGRSVWVLMLGAER